MDKLHLLKLFIAVVDRGSFASAAGNLGLSPSTISKAIARLEGNLNLLLFHRTTRQLTLTDHGRAYAETARRIIAELEQCEQQLSQANDTPKGRLRLNLPVSYGRLYVLPLLDKFRRRYPEIDLELSFNDAYVDMIEQGIDISIRSGTLDDSSLVARQLSPIDFLICASPDYLQRHGRPCAIAQFHQHQWIRFRYRQTGRLLPVMVPVQGEPQNLDPGRQFITDDGEALASLCAQGAGLTQIPHFIARDWLRSGEIESLWPFYRPKGYGVWIIYVKRSFLPSKIKAFTEFLQKEIDDQGETPVSTWVETLYP